MNILVIMFFSDLLQYFNYVIFFNCVSIRMIYIYLYFKDIKKSIHHIYTHNKIIELTLIKNEPMLNEEENKMCVEDFFNIFNIYNEKKENKFFVNQIKYKKNDHVHNNNSYYDDEEKLLLLSNINKLKEKNIDILLLLYNKILKEYLYYNLLSCVYFYFYRIIKKLSNIYTRYSTLWYILLFFYI